MENWRAIDLVHRSCCKLGQWSLQLNLYAKILRDRYGYIVQGMKVICFHPSLKEPQILDMQAVGIKANLAAFTCVITVSRWSVLFYCLCRRRWMKLCFAPLARPSLTFGSYWSLMTGSASASVSSAGISIAGHINRISLK
jgi:hypothetical protein